MSTFTFIHDRYNYIHSFAGGEYLECHTNRLEGYQCLEGYIKSSDIAEDLYKNLNYFTRRTCEFVQPCYSDQLSVTEMLNRIVEEHGGLWYYFTLENNLITEYYREDNRDTFFKKKVLYPWYIQNKETIKMLRKVTQHGTFVLGIDKLSIGKFLGGKVYNYL